MKCKKTDGQVPIGCQFVEGHQNEHLFADGLGRPRQDIEDALDAAVDAAVNVVQRLWTQQQTGCCNS